MVRPSKFFSSLLLLGTLAVSLPAQATPIGTASAPNVINLGTLAASDFRPIANGFGASTSESFYDNFTFSLAAPSSFLNFVSSFNSGAGISNLSAHLFQGAGPVGSLVPLAQSLGAPMAIAPGAYLTQTFMSVGVLSAGTYTLQMRGDVAGSGAYGGTMTVAAIPEPETYGMLLTGLALIALVARRKSQAVQ